MANLAAASRRLLHNGPPRSEEDTPRDGPRGRCHGDDPASNAVPIAEDTWTKARKMDAFVTDGLVDRIVLGETGQPRRLRTGVPRSSSKGPDVKVIGCMSVHGAAMAGPEHHTSGVWPGAMYHTPDYRTKSHEASRRSLRYGRPWNGLPTKPTKAASTLECESLFIACRNPESLKEYRRKLDREAAERLASGVRRRDIQTCRDYRKLTASVGPIDAKPEYADRESD